MDKHKAEQEVSALVAGMTMISMVVPVLLTWAFVQFGNIASYFVQVGALEQSDRVILNVFDGAGLDLGRVLILGGVLLLFGTLIGKIYILIHRN